MKNEGNSLILCLSFNASAGMIGQRALLSAVSLGLCARPVGAFYDTLTAELVQVSLQDEWPVHFVAIGALS